MKIAIAGYGIEGKANYQYWNAPDNDLTIVDERENIDDLPEGVGTILGEGTFSRLADFDMVIRTASLRPDKIQTNGKVWSSTNEFFAKCPAPIIGVTGTKGKGTTCSLIASILRAADKTVHLEGNIGVPALAELSKIQPDDIVVYELSSFQLWDVEKSPHVAVVLMIEPDHLDIHNTLEEYVGAKANIVRYQSAGDVVIYNSESILSRDIGENSAGEKYTFPYELEGIEKNANLPGKHNIENVQAAILAARRFDVDDQAIASGLAAFEGLEHRLRYVAEKNGVTYYDDSIATTPGSAIAALRSFYQGKVIILGGSDKGSDYTELVNVCNETDTKVIAVGDMGASIAELCANIGVVCERVEGDMTVIVHQAHEIAQPGDVVILSPAAASFDMFSDYRDRGEQFIAAVESL